MLPNFSYVKVSSVKEALEHLSSATARVHAGGIDLLGCLQNGVLKAEKLVSLSGLNELRFIREEARGVRLGALTPIAEIARHPLITGRYRALSDAAALVASPQLRNQGTLGGNLCQKPRCWYYRGDFECLRKGGQICSAVSGDNRFHCILGGDPCYMVHPSDTAAALVALEAEIRVAGPRGTKSISVEAFFVSPSKNVQNETVLQPEEIITEVFLPAPSAGSRSSYRKVRARSSWDFALAGVAIVMQTNAGAVEKCRVVLSGAAPIPWRAKEAEQALIGKPLAGDVIAQAAEIAVRNAHPLDHNAYKVPMFRGLIEQELKKFA